MPRRRIKIRCGEITGLLLGAIHQQAAVALAIALASPVRANPWSYAVFPVPQFSGYTSHFDLRTAGSSVSRDHKGLDIAAPMGSPVLSWWGGHVASLINDQSCGVGVVIVSGEYTHLYCHLQGTVRSGLFRSGPASLRKGDRVHAGQVIGQIGVSGRSTGPHLHWGVKLRQRWLDPVVVLREMAKARAKS